MSRCTRVLCVVVVLSICATHVFADDYDDNCTISRAECVPLTEECDSDFMTNPDFCRESNSSVSCCQYPLYCINGTCREDNIVCHSFHCWPFLLSLFFLFFSFEQGFKCAHDGECVVAFYGTGMHKCINSTCVMLLNANDYCSDDSECADSMTCENGRCQGFTEGQACTPPVPVSVRPAEFGLTHYVCGGGLVCAPDTEKGDSYHCRVGGGVTEECNITNPCNPYLVCNAGRCVKPYSVKVGNDCTVCYILCPKHRS